MTQYCMFSDSNNVKVYLYYVIFIPNSTMCGPILKIIFFGLKGSFSLMVSYQSDQNLMMSNKSGKVSSSFKFTCITFRFIFLFEKQLLHKTPKGIVLLKGKHWNKCLWILKMDSKDGSLKCEYINESKWAISNY